jgi:choline kinase
VELSEIVILAAGMGTRLGRPFPKPLTPLADGTSIMKQQVDALKQAFPDVPIVIVVGFKLDLVMEAFPDELYVYNELYSETNTSKSLLKGLRAARGGGVLWLNGDVVFDPAVLAPISDRIAAGGTFVCVNTARTADEEVKYTLDAEGCVDAISKTVVGGLGEAVGINYVSAADLATLIRRLDECDDNEYFERGLELGIEYDGLRVAVLDISDHLVVEVDSQEDLETANALRGSRGA